MEGEVTDMHLLEESDFEWEDEDGLDNFGFGGDEEDVRSGEGEEEEKRGETREVEKEEEEVGVVVVDGEKQQHRQRRPVWDAEMRVLARETHNVHAQILLSRVRELERALADDVLLHARLMSLAPEPPSTASMSSPSVPQSNAWAGAWQRACGAHGAHAIIDTVLQHLRTMLHVVWGFGRGGSSGAHQPLLPLSSSSSAAEAPVQSAREKILRELHSVLDDVGTDAIGICSVEFLAALSCAMFRLIGFETRLVCNLNPLGLKPGCLDEDDPRDDIVLHSRRYDTMKTAKHMTRSRFGATTETDDSGHAAQKKKTTKAKAKAKEDEASPSAIRANNAGTGDIDDEPARSKSKADIEFEAQMAVALTATAVTRKRERRKADTSERDGGGVMAKKKRANHKEKEKERVEDTNLPVTHWLEIFAAVAPARPKIDINTRNPSPSDKDKRWITVDPYRMLIDCAADMEAATALGRPVSYCVAVNVGGDVVDVTRRYASKFSRSVERRANDAWWNATLALMRRANASRLGCEAQPIDVDATVAVGKREAEEEEELAARVKTEKMPSNQTEYKKHHLYALERWLTKYQIIHPRKPILGYIAGHPVFPRAHVRDLHTADRWLREGRIVREEELDQPVKCVASREQRRVQREREKLMEARRKHERKHAELGMAILGGGDDDDIGENDDDENRPAPGAETNPATWLYGDWQTDVYVPPKAENGIVPRNARGHIDVWSPDFVPEGATHIRLPYIASIARKLGIDYAPAMVGFDMKMGKSVPRFDGIVVCSEYAEALELAFDEENQRRTDAAAKKATDEAVAAWSVLLRVIWRRHMLEKEDIAEDAERYRKASRGGEQHGKGATASTVYRPSKLADDDDSHEKGIDEDGERRADDALPVVREHFF